MKLFANAQQQHVVQDFKKQVSSADDYGHGLLLTDAKLINKGLEEIKSDLRVHRFAIASIGALLFAAIGFQIPLESRDNPDSSVKNIAFVWRIIILYHICYKE